MWNDTRNDARNDARKGARSGARDADGRTAVAGAGPDPSPSLSVPSAYREDGVALVALMEDLTVRLRDVRGALPPLGCETLGRELARARRRADRRARRSAESDRAGAAACRLAPQALPSLPPSRRSRSMETPVRSTPAASYTVSAQDRRAGDLRLDVEGRLRRACAEMSAEAFETVVSDVVAFRLRWELREPCW